MRHRGMAAAALDHDLQHVRRGQHGSGPSRENAMPIVGHDVQGEGCVRQRVQQAVGKHVPRAVEALLSRLEHETDLAGELVPPRRDQPGRARQHCRVSVVPAGMHPPRDRRGERQAGLLLQRQRVHVAAQQHRRAGPSTPQYRHRAGAGGSLPPLQRQVGQLGTRLGQRQRGLEPQLRLCMDRPAQGGDAGGDRPGLVEKVFGEHVAS